MPVTKTWIKKYAKLVASSIHKQMLFVNGQEPMDGDETELITKEILKELDKLNGNS